MASSKLIRKGLIVSAIIAGVLLVLVGALARSLLSSSVSTSEDGTHQVEIAGLSVTVAATEPTTKAPDQFVGVPHPDPEFRTTELGPNLTFHPESSETATLDPDEVLRAVYLGQDVTGVAYYLWQSGSSDLRQIIGQIIADFGAVGRFETSYGTEMSGDAIWSDALETRIAEMGLPTSSITSLSGPRGEQATLVVEWHALPRSVAAVAIYNDGKPLGWQRPVSGTVAFKFDVSGHDPEALGRHAKMVALTTSGSVWNEHTLVSD